MAAANVGIIKLNIDIGIGELVIPYGLADHSTGFATVPLAEVLAAMYQEA
jgi:predicted GH43/DUF377 family glycosyl hydrolase